MSAIASPPRVAARQTPFHQVREQFLPNVLLSMAEEVDTNGTQDGESSNAHASRDIAGNEAPAPTGKSHYDTKLLIVWTGHCTYYLSLIQSLVCSNEEQCLQRPQAESLDRFITLLPISVVVGSLGQSYAWLSVPWLG
jgi:hypothetical protein